MDLAVVMIEMVGNIKETGRKTGKRGGVSTHGKMG